MVFQIDRQQEPGHEILRVIRAEIAAARLKAASQKETLATRIHQARIACKRIRAALRLVRISCPELYARENGWFRDSAKRLAPFRDADVMLAGLRDLVGPPALRQLNPPFLTAMCDRLSQRRRGESRDVVVSERELARFVRRMRVAEQRLASDWAGRIGIAVLVHGFAKTHRRARKAMPRRVAVKAHQFHAWRKRTKLCGYQCRLLREIRPKVMKALWHELDKLGRILGEEHDFSVLRKFLRKTDDAGVSRREAVEGIRLVEKRRDELRRAALVLGRRMFGAKSQGFARRLKNWQRGDGGVCA